MLMGFHPGSADRTPTPLVPVLSRKINRKAAFHLDLYLEFRSAPLAFEARIALTHSTTLTDAAPRVELSQKEAVSARREARTEVRPEPLEEVSNPMGYCLSGSRLLDCRKPPTSIAAEPVLSSVATACVLEKHQV